MDDVCTHDFDSLAVVSSLRDDEVGISFCRFNKLFVHRFQHIKVAVDDHLRGASAFHSITLYDADKSLVGVGIYE